MGAEQHEILPVANRNWRRYVLDSLAVGLPVSVRTSNDSLTASLFEIGNRMGAKVSIRQSRQGRMVDLTSSPDARHFDLYTLH